ncbi:MAG: PLP-dependent aminotransferase family protein [Desulfobacteraceae bacterium]|nr:PLP-dependent aminotransferase family protein [Desulfobacteraceae bacterium]
MNVSQVEIQGDMIDLGLGQPGLSLLPIDQLREAAGQRIVKKNALWLQYGAELGAGDFREVLSEFLTQAYGYPVASDQLMITNGISHGLSFLCSRMTHPRDVVFVEEPSYLFALQLFADFGLNIVGIPTDREGIIVDELEAALKIQKPAFLYIIPTYHNPSGISTCRSRRIKLAELSEIFNFWIVADDAYHLLNFDTPPPPMPVFDPGGRIFSLGSFSKILAPGLRLGWIHADASVLNGFIDTGILQSGGGFNPFTSAIVHHIIETGQLGRHIENLKQHYARRAATLSSSLRRDLPEIGTFTDPGGGFFIWLRLPDRWKSGELRKMALSHNVNFQPGFRFSSRGGLNNYIRLCFAFYRRKELEEGVQRLAESADDYVKQC